MNGIQAYRCLNTLSEHVDFCSTYTLTSQVYSCSGCESGNELKMIPIGSENQPRCLNTLTQIVLNCASYSTDGANGFVCSSCDSGFTLKTVSGSINACQTMSSMTNAQLTSWMGQTLNVVSATLCMLFQVFTLLRVLSNTVS